MWHVDEGILNSYLDGELEVRGAGSGEREAGSGEREAGNGEREAGSGKRGTANGDAEPTRGDVEAHLAVCSECRDLLDEVTRIRDRAAGILAASGPAEVTVPPFEEVRLRSRARTSRGHARSLTRMKTLAWAATVVLAVAVGWYARGTGISGTDQYASLAESTVASSEPTEQAGSGERGAGEEAQRLAATEVDRQEGIQEDRPPPTPLPPGGQAGRRAGGQRDVTEEEPSAKAAAPTEARAKPDPEAESRADLDAAALVSRERKRLADAALPLLADAAPVAAQQVAADRADVSRLVAGRGAAGNLAWTSASEEVAQAFLGREMLKVEGLSVVDYATSVLGGRRAVRVRQRLDSENTLELVLHRESAGPRRGELVADALEEAVDSDSMTTLSGRLSGYRITLRAAVSGDSLRALLTRIR